MPIIARYLQHNGTYDLAYLKEHKNDDFPDRRKTINFLNNCRLAGHFERYFEKAQPASSKFLSELMQAERAYVWEQTTFRI